MGDQDNCPAFLVQLLQNLQDFLAGCAIQVTCRLICRSQAAGGHSFGDGNPLLLSAGHLLGLVVHTVLQTYHLQGIPSLLLFCLPRPL